MTERRQKPRVRVDSVAFIVTQTGNPVACRIEDISEDGARLIVDSVLGIPDRFRLVVQKTGEDRPATVVWRGPRQIGVSFPALDGVQSAAPRIVSAPSIASPLCGDPSFSAPDDPAGGADLRVSVRRHVE